MTRPRKHIGLKTKLAAAIGALFFSYDERKELSEDQILSLVQWDHDPVPHAAPYNGPDTHDNLVPNLIIQHRIKTATKDVPAMAKGKRVAATEAEFRARTLAPRDQRPPKKTSFKSGRKMRSRNTFKKRGEHG